jgi:hypothetical protein
VPGINHNDAEPTIEKYGSEAHYTQRPPKVLDPINIPGLLLSRDLVANALVGISSDS